MMSNCTRLTDSTFADEVLSSSRPVLVEFWGSWCPPCKMMEPVLEVLAERLADRVKICKLNVDQHPKYRTLYQILGVPTFMVFDGGKAVRRGIGAHSLQQLVDLIEAALSQRAVPRSIVELPTAVQPSIEKAAETNSF